MSSVAKRTRSFYKRDSVSKRFKVDEKEDKDEHTTTTVLHLNDDCLQEVFSFLSKNDLVNVRLANSRFVHASEKVFIRKYSKSQAIASMSQENQCQHMLKSSLDLLAAFGHLITKLLIGFKLEKVEQLLDAVIDHCGEKINELELCHFGVSISHRNAYNSGLRKMNSFLVGLNERFPNLHRLKIEYRNSTKSCLYIKSLSSIPSLKSFAVSGALFSLDDIRRFVEANRQIDSLDLIGETNDEIRRSLHVSQDFLNDLDTALPQLKMLEICRVYIKPRHANGRVNRFQNLKMLTIGTLDKFTYFDELDLSFTGPNIEEISTYFYIHYLSDFTQYLSRFTNLKRLVLRLLKVQYITLDLEIRSLFQSLQFISANNILMEVVIELYREDENVHAVEYEELQYLNLIKSAFNTVQWSMIQVGNRLVISKVHRI